MVADRLNGADAEYAMPRRSNVVEDGRSAGDVVPHPDAAGERTGISDARHLLPLLETVMTPGPLDLSSLAHNRTAQARTARTRTADTRTAAASAGDTLHALDLAVGAAGVLRNNDLGSMVTAAPDLYPHMWSWDTGFIAVGLAHLDVARAGAEIRTLLAAQWADGMLPHIVYGPRGGYFPGPGRWGTAELNPNASDSPRTSGICQPPVHAIAVGRILEIARRGARADGAAAERLVRDVWPALYDWHAWLARHRDPDGTGLLGVVHGWESGMDNSPRWDAPYANVFPGSDLPPYVRLDRELVRDGAERPTDIEYDRYLWLIEEMRRAGYRPDDVVATSSFYVADVFVSAIFAVACDVLADLGGLAGADERQVAELRGWAARSRAAVAASCDPASGLARDFDRRNDRWIDVPTLAGFAPLLCGGLDADGESSLLGLLQGPEWAGHPGLAAAVPPTVSPNCAGFKAREYWRGPQWPVIGWLFGWALARRGFTAASESFRTEGLRLVGDGTFAEYYQPLTGEALGSRGQSWTAAVVLDWLHP
jgi:hypothetical protein